MPYEFIASRGKLSDEHRNELKSKRGFSDETIDKFRLFSGGKYILEFEEEILQKFTEENLVSTGIFTRLQSSNKLTISTQLLDNRIIIPYLRKDRSAYFLRPHKLGLEAPIEIYDTFGLFEEAKHHGCILTEGEFKAMAGRQLGFKTIAVPGVSSFVDKNFGKFMTFINEAKIKEICIIFDNEIKDNPSFSNYKEDPMKRFDTEYFSYQMAKRLMSEGIDARIGKIPDSWRVDGKIDIDGAVASGKTADDFGKIIYNSQHPKEYFESLTSEAQNIIKKKLAKKFHRTHIQKSFGKYYAVRKAGTKGEYTEQISNFIIKIVATHETPEGMVREVVLIDEFGKRSRPFPLPAEPMAKSDSFKAFCVSRGNFLWGGRNEDLIQIWQGEFLDDDGKHIIEPDHIGWVQEHKMWLFGNVAITGAGEEMRPDKSNVFWTKNTGVRPISVSISSGRATISEGIPYLKTNKADIGEVITKFEETIGTFEAKICLGWIAACAYMNEIFDFYRCFPFLFLVGKRGSGKSTVCEWLMCLTGLEIGGKSAEGTTAVALQRYMGYLSCMPLFIDEYRNTKAVTWKDGFFRSAYNRQSAGKGMKSMFGIREGKIRGTILFSGEETPEDNALLTRCIPIYVSDKKRSVNHFNWFQSHRSDLSYFFYHVLMQKSKSLEQFKEDLAHGQEYFVKSGLDERTAINYSIVAAGYGALTGDIPAKFQEYLASETSRVKREYYQEHAINVFWADLLAIQSMGGFRGKMWDSDDDYIYIYFNGLYAIWSMEIRKMRGIEPFKLSAIRDYLKEEPGFLEMNKVKKINGKTRRCMVFDIFKAPDELKDLVVPDEESKRKPSKNDDKKQQASKNLDVQKNEHDVQKNQHFSDNEEWT